MYVHKFSTSDRRKGEAEKFSTIKHVTGKMSQNINIEYLRVGCRTRFTSHERQCKATYWSERNQLTSYFECPIEHVYFMLERKFALYTSMGNIHNCPEFETLLSHNRILFHENYLSKICHFQCCNNTILHWHNNELFRPVSST